MTQITHTIVLNTIFFLSLGSTTTIYTKLLFYYRINIDYIHRYVLFVIKKIWEFL